MKKTIILVFLLFAMSASMTDAQFSGLGKSLLKTAQEAVVKGVGKAVERKVEQKATEQADSLLTRTLDNLGKAKKDSLIQSKDVDDAMTTTDSLRTVLKSKRK